jgi:hypothetical protein
LHTTTCSKQRLMQRLMERVVQAGVVPTLAHALRALTCSPPLPPLTSSHSFQRRRATARSPW